MCSRAWRSPTHRSSTSSPAWCGSASGAERIDGEWFGLILLAATVFLAGFRIGLNLEDPNVIDVGHWARSARTASRTARCPTATCLHRAMAAVGEADAEGEVRERIQTNGRCESSNERGDTYGPVAYLAYVPGYALLGWSGKWDELPAAHSSTSIALDLFVMLGSRSSAAGSAQPPARGRPALRLGRVSVHAVRVQLEHQRCAARPFPRLGLLARVSSFARGAFTALAAWTKSRRSSSCRSGRRTPVGFVARARSRSSSPASLPRRWRPSRSCCSSRA